MRNTSAVSEMLNKATNHGKYFAVAKTMNFRTLDGERDFCQAINCLALRNSKLP
jgi:hypothetical protein